MVRTVQAQAALSKRRRVMTRSSMNMTRSGFIQNISGIFLEFCGAFSMNFQQGFKKTRVFSKKPNPLG